MILGSTDRSKYQNSVLDNYRNIKPMYVNSPVKILQSFIYMVMSDLAAGDFNHYFKEELEHALRVLNRMLYLYETKG